jgi:hypothetical protein
VAASDEAGSGDGAGCEVVPALVDDCSVEGFDEPVDLSVAPDPDGAAASGFSVAAGLSSFATWVPVAVSPAEVGLAASRWSKPSREPFSLRYNCSMTVR